MKQLAGLLALAFVGSLLVAEPAMAVDVPSSSSLTAGPLAEAAAATGSTSTAAPSTASAGPVTANAEAHCHDANGKDVPCPPTPPTSTSRNPNLPSDAQSAFDNALTQADTARNAAGGTGSKQDACFQAFTAGKAEAQRGLVGSLQVFEENAPAAGSSSDDDLEDFLSAGALYSLNVERLQRVLDACLQAAGGFTIS